MKAYVEIFERYSRSECRSRKTPSIIVRIDCVHERVEYFCLGGLSTYKRRSVIKHLSGGYSVGEYQI